MQLDLQNHGFYFQINGITMYCSYVVISMLYSDDGLMCVCVCVCVCVYICVCVCVVR